MSDVRAGCIHPEINYAERCSATVPEKVRYPVVSFCLFHRPALLSACA
jgi:hypothetical protein